MSYDRNLESDIVVSWLDSKGLYHANYDTPLLEKQLVETEKEILDKIQQGESFGFLTADFKNHLNEMEKVTGFWCLDGEKVPNVSVTASIELCGGIKDGKEVRSVAEGVIVTRPNDLRTSLYELKGLLIKEFAKAVLASIEGGALSYNVVAVKPFSAGATSSVLMTVDIGINGTNLFERHNLVLEEMNAKNKGHLEGLFIELLTASYTSHLMSKNNYVNEVVEDDGSDYGFLEYTVSYEQEG